MPDVVWEASMAKFVGQGCAWLGEGVQIPCGAIATEQKSMHSAPKEHALCHAFQFNTRFTGFRLHKEKKFWFFETGMFMNWQSALSWLQHSSVQAWHFERGAGELGAALLEGKKILRDSWQTMHINWKLNALAYAITKNTWSRGEMIDRFSSEVNGVQLK